MLGGQGAGGDRFSLDGGSGATPGDPPPLVHAGVNFRPPPTFADLERLAIEAHLSGARWGQFWPGIAIDVERMASGDPLKFVRLRDRLLATLVDGDDQGLEPVGPTAWWEH